MSWTSLHSCAWYCSPPPPAPRGVISQVSIDVKGVLEEVRAAWLLAAQETSWRSVARVNGTHSYLSVSLGF